MFQITKDSKIDYPVYNHPVFGRYVDMAMSVLYLGQSVYAPIQNDNYIKITGDLEFNAQNGDMVTYEDHTYVFIDNIWYIIN